MKVKETSFEAGMWPLVDTLRSVAQECAAKQDIYGCAYAVNTMQKLEGMVRTLNRRFPNVGE